MYRQIYNQRDTVSSIRNFQQYFSYIMATNVSGGVSRSTRRGQTTISKQLVTFITFVCEYRSSFTWLILSFVGEQQAHITIIANGEATLQTKHY
jgi:hypothetical protein